MRTEREPSILDERYALQARLDRSPFGTVWLATDTVLDRRVTVTVIDPGAVLDATRRDRLFENARTLATAAPSRLVRLLDAGTHDDSPFLVTERIAGETLAEHLEREGPFPPLRAAGIVAEVLDGIGESDALGVTRIGIAASKVLLDERGHVRLLDPGLAEVALGPEAPGPRDDVTAAGALLFELVTGRRPEERASRHLDAPRSVRTILARSMDENDGHRFADAASMADALHDAARSDDRPERPPAPVRHAVFRTWIAVPLVVALVAAAVLGVGVWLGRIELGGPVGIRLPEEPADGSPAAGPVPIASISVLDPPPGDGAENDDDLPAAIDGDPTTVWRSENYFDGRLNKPGVGLVLDLGTERTITGFRVVTPAPGFAFSVLVGDDPASLVADAATEAGYTAPDAERGLDPRTGRYVVVWITSVVTLPDGSNRAEIADIRIVGTR